MKSLVLLVPLIASASAIPLESRQLPQLIAPKQRSLSIENIKPTLLRNNVQSIRMRYGPYRIKGLNSTEKLGNVQSLDPQGTGWNYTLDDFPKDVTILKTNSTMIYEDGTHADLASGLYTHHIMATDASKTAPSIVACPGNKTGLESPLSIFMATPESTDESATYFTSEDGSYNSGYYIGKNDIISFVMDVVNYSPDTKTVYIENDVQYLLGKDPKMAEASQEVISLGQCSGHGVSIEAPKGQSKFTLQSVPMTMRTGGRVLYMTGHLHDGGSNIIAKINGKQVCDSKAIYGGAGSTFGGEMSDMGGMGGGMRRRGELDPPAGNSSSWQTISRTTKCSNIQLQKNDNLTLEANYDLDAHPARRHASGEGTAEEMAIMTLYFAPDL